MEKSEGLQRALLSFMDAARVRLYDIQRQGVGDILSKPVGNVILPRLVEELESQQEFHHLVIETRAAFSGNYHKATAENAWHRAVHNYFCRSGYYLGLASGELESADKLFSDYWLAFTKPKVHITYLAPLEYVQFAESTMDFGTYQIKRFPLGELETILQNRVNSIFYPWAAIGSDDLKLLSQYWFIQVVTSGEPPPIGIIILPSSANLLFFGYAERKYTGFPPPVESVLRQICLFNWAGTYRATRKHSPASILSNKDEYDLWLKFSVPFFLEIDDNLIDFPEHVPDIKLNTVPGTDPETGEECKEPEVFIHLGQNDTQRFIAFTKRIQEKIHSLETDNNGWGFMEVALRYFVRAFFTEPGLEQLLWHIVVLEALFGEERKGVTECLAKRIGLVLGGDKNERQRISERFRQLYKVRNSLVHGKPESKADITEITDAYRFSRLAIIWFLNYLSHIKSEVAKCQGGSGLLKRKELLMLMSFSADALRGGLREFRRLMDKVSGTFPYVPDWIS